MNASKATTYGATEPAPAPAGKKWGRRDAVAAVLILASTAAAAAYVSGSGPTGLRGATLLLAPGALPLADEPGAERFPYKPLADGPGAESTGAKAPRKWLNGMVIPNTDDRGAEPASYSYSYSYSYEVVTPDEIWCEKSGFNLTECVNQGCCQWDHLDDGCFYDSGTCDKTTTP